jgi:glycosyltransferase involved in cell wall biosynthesis/O-antigen ligase
MSPSIGLRLRPTPGHILGGCALVGPTLALYQGLAIAPLVIVAGIAAAFLSLSQDGTLPRPPVTLTALIFIGVAWAAISLGWTIEEPLLAAWRLTRMAFMCGAGLLLVASANRLSAREIRVVAVMSAAGMLIALVVMAIETTLGAPILGLFARPLSPYWPRVLDHYDRGLTVVSLVLWPTAALLGPKRRLPALGLFLAALLLLPLFAQSTALLALVVGLASALVIFIAPSRAPLWFAGGLLGLILLSPLGGRLGPSPDELNLAQPGAVASGEHRLVIWRFVADHVFERPLLGWGFDSSRVIPGGQREFAPTAMLLPLHPHNAGLQWWLELGLPGAALGAGLLAWCAARLRRITDTPTVAAAAGALFTATTYAELSYGIWQGWWLATLLLGGALMAAAVRLQVVGGAAMDEKAATRPERGAPKKKFRLLYFVTEDWYFWSHRLNIATAAHEVGCEVVVVTRAGEFAEPLRTRGFRVINIHLRRGRMISLFEIVTLSQAIWIFMRERPDAVHLVGLKPCLYGGLAASLARIPGRIYALAGLGYIFTTSRSPVRLIRLLITTALRQLLRHSNSWLMLQNRDDRDMFVRSGIAPDNRTVMVRGSGVDIQAFSPSPFPPMPIVAAQVSRMLRDKGVADLVVAARQLQLRGVSVRIKLVGDTDRHNPSSIAERQLRRWTDEHVVEWTGFRSDIVDLWRATHIAVLASYREGLPKSLLEAGASGRAIVATDVPGNRELVIDGETGLLVPVGQPSALAAAIERLASDPALCERLGAAARRRVEREFSDARIVAATLDLYRRVAGPRWPGNRELGTDAQCAE